MPTEWLAWTNVYIIMSALVGMIVIFAWDICLELHVQTRLEYILFRSSHLMFLIRKAIFFGLGGLGGGGIGWALLPGWWSGAILGLFLGVGLIQLYFVEQRKKIRLQRSKQFPFFLECLALAHASGYQFNEAWKKSVEFLSEGPLKQDLNASSTSLRLGKSIPETCDDLAVQFDGQSEAVTWTLISEYTKLGTPLKNLLLSEAEKHRTAYWTQREKQAQTLSLRLLFPILLFIFPSIFIALFGPLAMLFL